MGKAAPWLRSIPGMPAALWDEAGRLVAVPRPGAQSRPRNRLTSPDGRSGGGPREGVGARGRQAGEGPGRCRGSRCSDPARVPGTGRPVAGRAAAPRCSCLIGRRDKASCPSAHRIASPERGIQGAAQPLSSHQARGGALPGRECGSLPARARTLRVPPGPWRPASRGTGPGPREGPLKRQHVTQVSDSSPRRWRWVDEPQQKTRARRPPGAAGPGGSQPPSPGAGSGQPPPDARIAPNSEVPRYTNTRWVSRRIGKGNRPDHPDFGIARS